MKSEPATVVPTPDNPPELTSRLPAATNGSPSHGPSRLPRAKGWSSRAKILLAGGGVLLLGLVAVGILLLLRNPLGAARPDLVLHKVRYDRLELTVIERGALESQKN